jgi:4'-phosphopantetheinyl transferase
MNKINVRLLSKDVIKKNLYFFLNYVSKDRLTKYYKYKNENDKLLTLGSGYFIKKYVNGNIFYNKYHKPYSDNMYFNISHSFDYVVFISCNKECGIDIEKITSSSPDMSLYMFDEIIKDDKDFYYHFTLKEALLKCVGTGFCVPNVKEVVSKEGLINYQNNNYYLKSFLWNDYYISICINSDEDFDINIIEELL